MFTALRNIADVSLGYKSLQNDFFYVNQATISTYGIEQRFLVPILMLKDFDISAYEQSPKPSVWLFACKEKRGDLRGTGAWRYIESMADRSAAEKKQSGKNLTIKEALVVAEDKRKKTKKQQSDSIGSVADSIVATVELKLKTKNFPDDFAKGAKLDLPLLFDRGSLKEITVGRLLDSYDIEVHAKGGGRPCTPKHTLLRLPRQLFEHCSSGGPLSRSPLTDGRWTRL